MSRDLIKRYWFLTALIVLIPIGMTWPELGKQIKESGHVIPILVGIMLGIAGFTMDTSKLVQQSSNYRAIIPVLASTYLLAPLLAYCLSQVFAPANDENFLPAMMIMAAQAGSLASAIALTLMAGGNRELALICTLISNGLTVLLTPFVLELSIGTKVNFPIADMIARMTMVILLPVAMGQLLRSIFWEKTRKFHEFIRIPPIHYPHVCLRRVFSCHRTTQPGQDHSPAFLYRLRVVASVITGNQHPSVGRPETPMA